MLRWVFECRLTPLLAGLRLAAAVGPGGVLVRLFLPGGTSEVSGDDVDGVPVQAAAGTVVPHSGAGSAWEAASCTSRSGTPGVQGRRDERVPQSVRPDQLGDPGTTGDPAHNPRRAVAVQPPAVGGQEQRPVAAVAHGQVDRPGGSRREWAWPQRRCFTSPVSRPVCSRKVTAAFPDRRSGSLNTIGLSRRGESLAGGSRECYVRRDDIAGGLGASRSCYARYGTMVHP
jgi:hypothetical protein